MRDNCPFCDINKLGNRIIYSTRYSLSFLSNPSLAEGHTLVIPKRHIENISFLTREEISDLFSHLNLIEENLLKKFSGCDIRQNYRLFLPLSKFKVDHLHFHLIPRVFEDEIYSKSQIYEKDIFRDLSKEDEDLIINKLFSRGKNAD